jgi:transposase
VFGYFARWAKAGVLRHILDQLRRRLRLHRRRCPWPVRVIVDSQSVKGAETVSKTTRGYDANKHINGRKRHLLVDQDGLLVDLLVTPADVQDRDAARVLLTRLHAEHPEIVLVWADNGYAGDEFSTWAQTTLGITVKVVSRPKDAKGDGRGGRGRAPSGTSASSVCPRRRRCRPPPPRGRPGPPPARVRER